MRARTSTDEIKAGLAADVDGGFEALVREYQHAVYTLALRCTGDRHEAEDLAQDAFARAYQALRGYGADRIGQLQPRAFLLTIVLNAARNRARDKSRRPATSSLAADVATAAPGPGDVLAGEDALARQLAAVDEKYRAPIVLRHVLGLGYAEMAEITGLPAGTLKARVSRGLAAVRTALTTEAKP